MLKTKLYQACFITCSFILMAVASGSNPATNQPLIDTASLNKELSHRFDSTGLCSCIPGTISGEPLSMLTIQLNKHAAPFVKEYIKKNGFFIGKTKKRVTPYFTVIDSVFKQADLPVELKYLAYIESGLKCHTVSKSGAIGPWAFMPVAAKEYGLKISKYKDERLDYFKSSIAAAALLADLFAKYEDWLLVIAAYNCGPGYVQKAIKRSGSRNYWELQNFLPKETRSHVKKFIAVHYYFEGHGSLTTMTKAETEMHVRDVEGFVNTTSQNPQTP